MVMPVQLLANGNLQIQEYSLIDFLQEVQKYVIDGYRIDFVTNEGYPQQLGTIYLAQLVPASETEVVRVEIPYSDKTSVEQKEETEVKTPNKHGRKSKVQA
jgi:hypothetical protein